MSDCKKLYWITFSLTIYSSLITIILIIYYTHKHCKHNKSQTARPHSPNTLSNMLATELAQVDEKIKHSIPTIMLNGKQIHEYKNPISTARSPTADKITHSSPAAHDEQSVIEVISDINLIRDSKMAQPVHVDFDSRASDISKVSTRDSDRLSYYEKYRASGNIESPDGPDQDFHHTVPPNKQKSMSELLT